MDFRAKSPPTPFMRIINNLGRIIKFIKHLLIICYRSGVENYQRKRVLVDNPIVDD